MDGYKADVLFLGVAGLQKADDAMEAAFYRETIEKESETVIRRELVFDNHSEVMFDYALIPPDQIRGEEAACCE